MNVGTPHHKYPPLPSLRSLGLSDPSETLKKLSGDRLPKMGKFRFQLFADWITEHFKPCRVADIGGGKGLLSYFLRKNGFDPVVIDPVYQELPEKIRDVHTREIYRFKSENKIKHICAPFDKDLIECNLAASFDLFIALHAHGCNLNILLLCKKFSKQFAILPCCVIDEPEVPPQGMHWIKWLGEYAMDQEIDFSYFKLNFKGQSIGLCSA
jgi:hypothetical protein